MKKYYLLILLIFFLSLYCINSNIKYITTDEAFIYNQRNDYADVIKKNTPVSILLVSSNFHKFNEIYSVLLKIEEDKWINAKYVSLYPINKKFTKYKGIWIPSYYVEAVKKNNKEIIYEYQEQNKEDYSAKYFWHFFTPTVLFITGLVIHYQCFDLAYDCIIEQIKENGDNTIEVSGIYKEPGIYGEIENVNFKLRLEENRLFIKSFSSWEYLEEEFELVW